MQPGEERAQRCVLRVAFVCVCLLLISRVHVRSATGSGSMFAALGTQMALALEQRAPDGEQLQPSAPIMNHSFLAETELPVVSEGVFFTTTSPPPSRPSARSALLLLTSAWPE